VHCKEQKNIQLIVLYFVITTHAKFIRTPSTAQAISYRSHYYLSLEEPTNQLIDWILKIINLIQVKHLPTIRQ